MSSSAAIEEWRRGWPMVLLTVIGLTCAPTTLPVYTLGVFVVPFGEEFGWGRGSIQAAILFSTGLAAFSTPMAGNLIRRFGLRRTILPSLVGMAFALVLAAANTGSLWQLYAIYALMSVLGAGAGAVAWTTLIIGRFDRARGLALGVALSGTGLCAALMPQIATLGLIQFGWRGAYITLALFVAVIVLPVCALMLPHEDIAERDEVRPPVQHAGIDASEAVRRWRFWALGMSTAAIYLVVGGLLPNIVPALLDSGASAAAAASIMGLFGIAVIVGRISVGALVDRFWAPLIAALVLVPAAVGCILLQTEVSIELMAAAVILVGMATGMELDVLSFLATKYFGVSDYPRIYGRLYIFVAAAAGVAPMIFGYVYDWTGSYALPLQASAILLLLGAFGLIILGRYPEWPQQHDFA